MLNLYSPVGSVIGSLLCYLCCTVTALRQLNKSSLFLPFLSHFLLGFLSSVCCNITGGDAIFFSPPHCSEYPPLSILAVIPKTKNTEMAPCACVNTTHVCQWLLPLSLCVPGDTLTFPSLMFFFSPPPPPHSFCPQVEPSINFRSGVNTHPVRVPVCIFCQPLY